jgi:3-oxoacyl-[acyl-carrier-protein] synthase-3
MSSTTDKGLRTRILGMGHYVPPKVVTNADLTRVMDTTEEWIEQRTGIQERHFVDRNLGAADLGVLAARDALAAAETDAADLDLILLGTLSPDVDFPASASLLQRELGVSGMPALDVRNQCSGFLYGLAIADQFIRTGAARRVLLVGSEVHSSGLDLSTRGREVGVIFGDGAGAVVLGPEERPQHGILSIHLHAEGRFARKLCVEPPSSLCAPRLDEETITAEDGRLFPKMEGRYVFRHAVTRFPEVIREALDANGLTIQDIDLCIPHQANLRISQIVAATLEIPEEKMFNNISKYGNTTAASIPIALHEAVEAQRIRPGMLVCLAAFGSGFTWASALIRW